MNDVMGLPVPTEPFDAYEKDCFAKFINLNDGDVTSLINQIHAQLNEQGEYDQEDSATLYWDNAADLCAVAHLLWHFRLQRGWTEDDTCDVAS